MKATIAALAGAFAMCAGAAVAQPVAASPAPAAATGATITVHVIGLRSVFGSVQCFLYVGGVGFPRKPEKAVGPVIVPIAADSTATCAFQNVAPGEYAIQLFHDENGNGKFDTDASGIPMEGYGASRDPPERFAAPKYANAKFKVTDGAPLTFAIHMTYLDQ